jgi:hypothetical protein
MRKTGKAALTSALIGAGIFVLHLAVDSIRQNDSRVFVWGMVAVAGFFVICFVVAFCWSSVTCLVSSRRKSRTPEPASDEEIK